MHKLDIFCCLSFGSKDMFLGAQPAHEALHFLTKNKSTETHQHMCQFMYIFFTYKLT
jgi:hypothetical protein